MVAPADETFGRKRRISAQRDYRRLFRAGRRLDGRFFLLVAAAAAAQTPRLGLSVARRVGGAVTRNRVKRLLREAYRRQPAAAGEPPLDVLLVAKPGVVDRTQEQVAHELAARLAQLRRVRPAACGSSCSG